MNGYCSKKTIFFYCLNKVFCFLFCFLFFLVSPAFSSVKVQTVWGEHSIDHPLLEKLINSSLLKRLQHVDQSGPLTYFGYVPKFSRYEHSVGVLALLQKVDAPLKEQVAGLLHDVSHTTFSHVGDHLFYVGNIEQSYQDTIHIAFLNDMNAQAITEPYGISLEMLEPDLPEYKALEQKLPELCADRIQYFVHTGVLFNKITQDQARALIADIQFKDGVWFFTEKEHAKRIALLSLYFTKEFWGAPWDLVFYEYFAKVLNKALSLKVISLASIQYGTDNAILDLLKTCNDPFIKESFENLKDISKCFKVVPFGQGDLNIKPKFRGVDPLVKVGSKLERLSSIDSRFMAQFEEIKVWCNKGYGINMLVKDY